MTEEQKDFQQRIENQLQEYAAKIDEVKAKAQRAEARAKMSYYDHLEDLRIKERGARVKLAELEHADGRTWNIVKTDLETALQNLEAELAQA